MKLSTARILVGIAVSSLAIACFVFVHICDQKQTEQSLSEFDQSEITVDDYNRMQSTVRSTSCEEVKYFALLAVADDKVTVKEMKEFYKAVDEWHLRKAAKDLLDECFIPLDEKEASNTNPEPVEILSPRVDGYLLQNWPRVPIRRTQPIVIRQHRRRLFK